VAGNLGDESCKQYGSGSATYWKPRGLLNEFGGEIEADLLRFYRVDLLDYHRGSLSLRRLGVLIKHLPADSALVRALTDPVRAEQARREAKEGRVIQLNEKRKRTYGLR